MPLGLLTPKPHRACRSTSSLPPPYSSTTLHSASVIVVELATPSWPRNSVSQQCKQLFSRYVTSLSVLTAHFRLAHWSTEVVTYGCIDVVERLATTFLTSECRVRVSFVWILCVCREAEEVSLHVSCCVFCDKMRLSNLIVVVCICVRDYLRIYCNPQDFHPPF